MPIDFPALPYDRSALEPHLSADTVEQHHDRHQRAHVDEVNALIADTPFAESSLEEIVRKAQGRLFDHAAQAWNIQFYWQGLKPASGGGGGTPGKRLTEVIARQFGDSKGLQQQFNTAAMRLFGAGWVWLVQRRGGGLAIIATANASTPLTGDDTPLLACSLWEHAWYLDYRHARDKYLDAFWHLVDWDAVAGRLRG
ncbi:superoxide dismutase [Luteimonas sp. RIT-PG2_3]|jgi:Fe-Mn family superoxide dismutase